MHLPGYHQRVARWVPDDMLVPAVRSGRCPRKYADLSVPDRAWVIAGLTQAGLTAEHISNLLGCCVRTVRVVQSSPMAQICRAYMRETAAFTGETRLLRSELSAATVALNTAEGEAKRLRDRLVRLTSPKTRDGIPLCARGHPMSKYNVYTHGSRRLCRECHKQDQANYRARKVTVDA